MALQQDIVTVTLNPALDLATVASDIRPGPKLRCGAPRLDPGGGGINVSRAIRTLGGRACRWWRSKVRPGRPCRI